MQRNTGPHLTLKSGVRAGRGLGDAVAGLTHATKLDKLTEAYSRISGRNCGCDARQNMLNQIELPF